MSFEAQYVNDRKLWDACAGDYEQAIVLGHPDVLAYEAFEEDLLDRILAYLIRDCQAPVRLLDVGCGSARLHLRYGLKTKAPEMSPAAPDEMTPQQYAYDPALAEGLRWIGGMDFSEAMVQLGRRKLAAAGLETSAAGGLALWQASAFDLEAMVCDEVPVAVSVCNSVGVMQGPEGAQRLFKSMRRVVERSGGIAIISGYRRDAVASHALGNYESTMHVSGQPLWLTPETYAGPEYRQIPAAYKRAWDQDDSICVRVFDRDGGLVCPEHHLTRIPEQVRDTIATGHIRMHSGYESRWYATEQYQQWIAGCWPANTGRLVLGEQLDTLRAHPVQLAVLDLENRLAGFWRRHGVKGA